MTPNVALMVQAGYVTSPNNIWNTEGVEMYAGGPGIMEPKPHARLEVWVTDAHIRVIRFDASPRADGSGYLDFTPVVVNEFPTVGEYLSWVAVNGGPSEPGLPAYSNSWD